VVERFERLGLGQVFKNYSEICNFMEVKAKTGVSKQVQLARWREQFTWKTGTEIENENQTEIKTLIGECFTKHCWVILDTHVNPVKEHSIMTTVATTGCLIAALLSERITKGNAFKCTTPEAPKSVFDIHPSGKTRKFKNLKTFEKTDAVFIPMLRREFLHSAGLVNSNFKKLEYKKGRTTTLLNNFYTEIKAVSYKVIDNALAALQNNKVIQLYHTYEIVLDGVNKIASPELVVEVNAVYLQLMVDYKFKTKQEMFMSASKNDFYKDLGVKLKTKLNITYCDEMYLVLTTQEMLDNYMRMILPDVKRFASLKDLSNGKQVHRLYKHFQAAYNRYLLTKAEQDAFIDFSKVYKLQELPNDYVEKNKNLTDEYIKI